MSKRDRNVRDGCSREVRMGGGQLGSGSGRREIRRSGEEEGRKRNDVTYANGGEQPSILTKEGLLVTWLPRCMVVTRSHADRQEETS